MLYETLLQGQIFLCVLYFGLIGGVVFEAKNLMEKSLSQNKVVCFVLDLCYMLFCALLFIFAKNIANFGEFRIYLLISFVIGVLIEHLTIGFLVEKFFMLLYNGATKLSRRMFLFKPKSKFMQKLLK